MTASLGWYALAVLLVAGYVNTFVLWQILLLRFGTGAALVPWLFAAVFAVGVGVLWRYGTRRAPMRPRLLLAALLLALVGMLLVDPAFPAKRIHVPQYAILAAVVWAALRPHLVGSSLVFFVVLIGGLFGVHDEFLQGLHADRTFGLRDMAINLCGVTTGALILAGLTGRRIVTRETLALPASVIAAGAMAIAGLALYLVAIAGLRVAPVPYWPALPMLAGTVAFAWALAGDDVTADIRHAGGVIVILLTALCIYPIVVNETPFDFA